MNKRFALLKLAMLAWSAMGIAAQEAEAVEEKKAITFAMAFRGEGPPLTRSPGRHDGWLDEHHFVWTETPPEKPSVSFKVDARTGERTPILETDQKPDGGRNSLQRTKDRTAEAWIQDGDLYVLQVEKGLTRRLTFSKGLETNPRFSPDGRWLAYTRDHNLYALEIESGLEKQLTADGSDTTYNGYASWVYYEEILGRSSKYRAFWWSPDSAKLLFMRFDDSPVPTFSIYHEEGVYGKVEVTRYPKPGDANPLVRMGVVAVADGATVWMDFDETRDAYLAWPFWTPDSRRLHVQWLNRDQNHLVIYECDSQSGAKKAIYEERQETWVEFFSDINYLEDGSGFLLRSDKDGRHHLYLHAMDGSLKARLTSGSLMVDSIEAVDGNAGKVYFRGRDEDTSGRYLYAVNLDGGDLVQITRAEGVHQVSLSPGFHYFLDNHSNFWSPRRTLLCRADGVILREMGDSRNPEAEDYRQAKIEYFKIPTSDGWELPAWWVVPDNFDREAQKRYAVIFRIYSGPAAPTVTNRYRWRWRDFYYANQDVITMSVDHRASGHFGKTGTANMYRKLGHWEVHDLVEAVKWLRTQGFIDSERVGITGGSYGGYMTLLALFKAPEYFTHGISVAPVTDWRLYDTVYTERYMDTPQANPEGYRDGSVLEAAKNLRGELLLMHGTIDDNVHFQQSLQLIDVLTNAKLPFELMIYPGSRHGVRQRGHMNDLHNRFWFRHFLGRPFAEPESGTQEPYHAGLD